MSSLLRFMDLWLNSFTVCYMLHAVTWAGPINTETDARSYLESYHYSQPAPGDNKVGNLVDKQVIINAIKHFQRAWGLNVTGLLDNATRALMGQERCGVPDVYKPGDGYTTRKKRYTLQGSRWYKKDLTYKISSYPTSSSMTRDQINQIIDEAVKIWEDVTPLTLRKTSTNFNADINLKFDTFWHGDEFPFDGIGGTLAHAFFPQYGGDVHFDAHEVWTLRSKYGTNLFQVAVHELGHSLGLGHSFNRDSLMAPFYEGYTPNFSLHPDDVVGIQLIYGVPEGFKLNTAPQPPPPPKPQDNTPRCESIIFDTVTSHMDNTNVFTYAFFGEYYTRLDIQGMVSGYPRKISSDWPGLPPDLDAALYWSPQFEEKREWDWSRGYYKNVRVQVSPARTYFFKGSHYWRFENKRLLSGYPRSISTWFRGVPDNIDAAFVWSGNGVTYFIKGNKYYRYSRGSGVDPGYPMSLSVWKGLPSSITTALQWNENHNTYFFSGEQYYKFDDKFFQVASSYPRDVLKWWLNCRSQGLHEAVMTDQFSDNTTQDSSTTLPNSASVITSSKITALLTLTVILLLLL